MSVEQNLGEALPFQSYKYEHTCIKSILNYIKEPYLGKIQESCSTQLLLNNKGLLQKLEPARQELVLDLKEVSFAHVHLEGFIDDGEPCVVLYLSPFAVAVTYNS